MDITKKDLFEICTTSELLEYIEKSNNKIRMDEKSAEVLLGYLEGHAYQMAYDKDSYEMYRIDICVYEDQEIEKFPLDDYIDMVCEWNYELIETCKKRINNPDNFIDFCNESDYGKALAEDEKVLDELFKLTKSSVIVDEMANKISNVFTKTNYSLSR